MTLIKNINFNLNITLITYINLNPIMWPGVEYGLRRGYGGKVLPSESQKFGSTRPTAMRFCLCYATSCKTSRKNTRWGTTVKMKSPIPSTLLLSDISLFQTKQHWMRQRQEKPHLIKCWRNWHYNTSQPQNWYNNLGSSSCTDDFHFHWEAYCKKPEIKKKNMGLLWICKHFGGTFFLCKRMGWHFFLYFL